MDTESNKEVLRILETEVDKVRNRLHLLVNEVANQNLVITKITDKMEEQLPCRYHITSMKEINDTVVRIEIANNTIQGKVEGFISSVNRLLDKIEKDVYKENGLMAKTVSHSNQLILQWGIIGSLFLGGLVLFLWKK